ncbi:MAG: SDR family NAD(P)-dependent oxidoreductase [Alphaproteobacteria bacterium]|nr:SDR family NAD(P)-dependent oxidoreductase [Alphaproteobacteria bacterium]
MMAHPALSAGRTAVITGAASGIGLAAARRLAAMGLNLCLADRSIAALDQAAAQIGTGRIRTQATDVARLEDLQRLHAVATEAFGEVHLLMNNAGVGFNPGKPWENALGWRELLGINLWGVIHGVQAFVPGMLAHGAPAVVVNTGSKQGITLPPGNSAYNTSKAGVKAYTELLAHELRQAASGRVSAHLLVPGFTYTGMSNRPAKPAGAWTADQVIDVMIEGINRGDFYLFCQDNETPRAVDEKRMAWAAGDLIHNRPALSRWHPDFSEAFAAFLKD